MTITEWIRHTLWRDPRSIHPVRNHVNALGIFTTLRQNSPLHVIPEYDDAVSIAENTSGTGFQHPNQQRVLDLAKGNADVRVEILQVENKFCTVQTREKKSHEPQHRGIGLHDHHIGSYRKKTSQKTKTEIRKQVQDAKQERTFIESWIVSP